MITFFYILYHNIKFCFIKKYYDFSAVAEFKCIYRWTSKRIGETRMSIVTQNGYHWLVAQFSHIRAGKYPIKRKHYSTNVLYRISFLNTFSGRKVGQRWCNSNTGTTIAFLRFPPERSTETEYYCIPMFNVNPLRTAWQCPPPCLFFEHGHTFWFVSPTVASLIEYFLRPNTDERK